MVPLKTIDVAIGIAFLYLLITFGASVIVEMISTARNWRAYMLHDTIKNMLGEKSLVSVADIYENPQILALFSAVTQHPPGWTYWSRSVGGRTSVVGHHLPIFQRLHFLGQS